VRNVREKEVFCQSTLVKYIETQKGIMRRRFQVVIDMFDLLHLRKRFDVPYHVVRSNFRQLFIGNPVKTPGKCIKHPQLPIEAPKKVSGSKLDYIMSEYAKNPNVKITYSQYTQSDSFLEKYLDMVYENVKWPHMIFIATRTPKTKFPDNVK